ncbi:RNA polymerase sigma factor [Deferribacterales bacterium Es71-Z0220]|jgi:RNA polymerase sigma-70 factor (ECF subfamily)|uniref:RNA polymerase sigma factor n=1 Tax=Deferrivibrio essentukiensis TaxID=2880922 RepID=UPI001F618C8A|nr:RNA polymerase sigma factor [Deferrivibrio essentukiensis]MCB4203367.1 RNA polymerase sigma factor [Deferrivibrio essentukiensis]
MDKFQVFFDQTKKGFYHYLLSLTRDSALADDIFQETYFKILKKYKDKLSPMLLYKIGKNLFIDEYNRNKKHINTENITLSYEQTGSDNSMEADALLALLDDEEKKLFLMSAVDGLKYDEISAITGISVSNIKVKIFRARKKIQNTLKGG